MCIQPSAQLAYVSFNRQVHLVLIQGSKDFATLCKTPLHRQAQTSPVATEDIDELHTDLLCRRCAETFHRGGYRDFALGAFDLSRTTIHTDGQSIHPIRGEKQLDLF